MHGLRSAVGPVPDERRRIWPVTGIDNSDDTSLKGLVAVNAVHKHLGIRMRRKL
jgi:hypothetical protein